MTSLTAGRNGIGIATCKLSMLHHEAPCCPWRAMPNLFQPLPGGGSAASSPPPASPRIRMQCLALDLYSAPPPSIPDQFQGHCPRTSTVQPCSSLCRHVSQPGPCRTQHLHSHDHRIDVSRRLRRAILLNDLPLVRRILRNNPFYLRNPDFADKSNTSLHLAARCGFTSIVVR